MERFRRADRRGVFLDFDGTLSEIVARPELARLAPGAQEMLSALCRRVGVVAVISGRPTGQLRALVPVPGVRLVGLYGLPEDEGRERILAAVGEVESAAALVPGAWVEDKGSSLAVHYRAARNLAQAPTVLWPALQAIASRNGLSLFAGKMVVELAAGPVPSKGAVVRALAQEHALAGSLYAGDDLPDLDAFAALDELSAAGLSTLKVAVRTEETPEELLTAAGIVVERPAGLVQFLLDL